jgi:hypothetical protein
MPGNRPCDFFLKTSRHVQVAVTVNSLPTPLLSPAHPFAAKGCEGGDRSDGRKQNFLGSVLFQNPSLHFPLPHDLLGENASLLLLAVFFCHIKYRLSHGLLMTTVCVKTRRTSLKAGR